MKIEYMRTARCSYMIVKEADYRFEAYELQMVLYNHLSRLLPMQVIVTDGCVEYWYEVTGLQSVARMFAVEAVDYTKLRSLLQSICRLKRQMESYMLSDGNVNFSAGMIYADRIGMQVHFCYIPGYEQTQDSCIRGFLEELLQHLDHTDEKAVRLGYQVYELCNHSDFTVEECERCIRETEEAEFYALPKEDSRICHEENNLQIQENDRPERLLADSTDLSADTKPFRHRRKFSFGGARIGKERRKSQIDYGEILAREKQLDFVAEKKSEEWNPTVYFSEDERQTVWILAYRGDGVEQDLTMNSFPFLIGKDAKKTDGILQADTVSRIHARILEKEGKLFLEDYNSTNGTYLNGRLLPMNTPTELKSGDRLIFATEEYVLVDRKTVKC